MRGKQGGGKKREKRRGSERSVKRREERKRRNKGEKKRCGRRKRQTREREVKAHEGMTKSRAGKWGKPAETGTLAGRSG